MSSSAAVINFTSGFRVGDPIGVSCSYDKDGKRTETPIYPPETEFLEASGANFRLTVHKCAPGRKDYLIDPEWRNSATVKIQGLVTEMLCRELDNDNPCLWHVGKEFKEKTKEQETAELSAIKINLQPRNLKHVLSVIIKQCKLDAASSERLFAFVDKPTAIRETQERITAAKTARDQLWQSASQAKVGQGDLVLVHDLMKKDPTEKRNAIIKHAIQGNYGDFTSPWATPKLILIEHLKEAECPDLADLVAKGRYDKD